MYVAAFPEAQAAEFKGTTLSMPAPSWSTRLPTAVAEEGGFFKAEGVEVRGVVASGGPLMIALLLGGHAEMAMSGANAAVQAISRGAPIAIVGGVRNKMDYALIGTKGLKGLKDLKGKILGVTGVGSLGEFVTLESLKRSGLVQDRDYTMFYVEGGLRLAWPRSGREEWRPSRLHRGKGWLWRMRVFRFYWRYETFFPSSHPPSWWRRRSLSMQIRTRLSGS